MRKNYFNPHSREGSDLSDQCCIRALKNFNPHSREGSDRWWYEILYVYCHFNPHSREGSDLFISCAACSKGISIHTPAKGVTSSSATSNLSLIFQSTLPRREWPWTFNRKRLKRGFQSTLPRREWQGRGCKSGADRRFQSTLPRREWRYLTIRIFCRCYFNPHSREGSDKMQPF